MNYTVKVNLTDYYYSRKKKKEHNKKNIHQSSISKLIPN